MVLHRDLSGADLHEPKGIVGAPAGSVYISTNDGSGVWGFPQADTVVTSKALVSPEGAITIPSGVSVEDALQIILDFLDPSPDPEE